MAKKKKAQQQQPASEPPPPHGRTLRLSLFVALSLAALTLVYFLGDIFAPVLGALALAYMLDPVVKRLEKRGWRRKRAVLAVFAASILLMLVLLAASVPFVVRDVMSAIEDVSEELASDAGSKRKDADRGAAGRLARAIKKSESLRKVLEWAEEREAKKHAVKWLQDNAKALAGGAVEAGRAGLGFLAALGWWSMMLALFPVYLYFFMMGLGGLQGAALRLVPPSVRPKARRIGGELGASMAAFFRGRLVIALAIGVFTAAGFAIMGLRFGILLGMAIGLASIVPFVNVVFLVPALLIALFDFQSFWWVAAVFGVYTIGQALDPILTPYLLSRGTGLHPVTIIVSIFVWGRLLGATGLLLAVPLSAALKVIGRETVVPILAGGGSEAESQGDGS